MDEKEMQKKKIGSRIKLIRNELGLTMKEFGQKFDPPASDSIVSRWERGASLPNNERLKRIAELGNISMLYLTTGQKAIKDLSDNELKESVKTMKGTFKRNQKAQKEYLKNEFEHIFNSDLDIVETVYLANVLDYLKFSNKDDVMQLAAIVRMLNQHAGIGKDDSITKEEINEFIDEQKEAFGNFLKKRFSLLE